MSTAQPDALLYKRARFEAALPLAYRYTPDHFWIGENKHETGTFRVGLTKFGSRLLGEIVDFGFEVAAGSHVTAVQPLGWVEGFKAVTALVCVADGEFLGFNPALDTNPNLVNQDPHRAGWLYQLRLKTMPPFLEPADYAAVLDQRIDAWLAQSD